MGNADAHTAATPTQIFLIGNERRVEMPRYSLGERDRLAREIARDIRRWCVRVMAVCFGLAAILSLIRWFVWG